MRDALERGRDILAKQPFSQMLGTEMTMLSEGQSELVLPLTEKLNQQHGFAHGGVVTYLADNALSYAGVSVLGEALTLELKINFTRPAVGDRLIGRGSVISSGRRQAVCEGRVYVEKDGVEKLCAVAQGTMMVIESTK